MISASETVNIFVGNDNQTFAVHKDLIVLHSGYFANRFREGNEDEKIALPQFKPAIFADFHAWLYSGKFMQPVKPGFLSTPTSGEELWALGEFLRAPSFQNYVMDDNIHAYKTEKKNWIYVASFDSIYKNTTTRASLLRKLAVDVLTFYNPFQIHQEGSKAWGEWDALRQKYPDLSKDLAEAEGMQWNGTHPWDHEHRASYMVKEVPLEQTWEKQILAKRSKSEIIEGKRVHDIRSIIELAHLERRK